MFDSIDLIDFQSHQTTHLDLGPFTVIVGSSSSGKSAVVRALRLVSENARGTSYVRHGAQRTRVSLQSAGTVVTVERGKGVSAFTLRVPGMHDEPLLFTKCASAVPEAVADALGVGEADLWIAGQFDRPFLLDETGAEVAKVLGKLTNVNMIYAAVRETNRRAAENKRLSVTRQKDLDAARAELGRYATLGTRLAAGREAEAALDRAFSLDDKRSRLAGFMSSCEEASARSRAVPTRPIPDTARLDSLAAARRRLAAFVSDISAARARAAGARVGREVSVDAVDALAARRVSLRTVVSDLTKCEGASARLLSQIEDARVAADSARDSFAEALASAGSCPLCGADAAHAQVDHVV